MSAPVYSSSYSQEAYLLPYNPTARGVWRYVSFTYRPIVYYPNLWTYQYLPPAVNTLEGTRYFWPQVPEMSVDPMYPAQHHPPAYPTTYLNQQTQYTTYSLTFNDPVVLRSPVPVGNMEHEDPALYSVQAPEDMSIATATSPDVDCPDEKSESGCGTTLSEPETSTRTTRTNVRRRRVRLPKVPKTSKQFTCPVCPATTISGDDKTVNRHLNSLRHRRNASMRATEENMVHGESASE